MASSHNWVSVRSLRDRGVRDAHAESRCGLRYRVAHSRRCRLERMVGISLVTSFCAVDHHLDALHHEERRIPKDGNFLWKAIAEIRQVDFRFYRLGSLRWNRSFLLQVCALTGKRISNNSESA
jgi:hypothetical protein